jgi:hypothetical protein
MTGAGTWRPSPSTQRTFQKQEEIKNARNADPDA